MMFPCRIVLFVTLRLLRSEYALSAKLSRRPWTKYDDNAVRQLVAEHGTRNWAVVEQHMISVYGIVGRSGKQSRERWHNHLSELAINAGCREPLKYRHPRLE